MAVFLPQPARVEQPGGGVIPDLGCWAAALSMWQSVTPNRKKEVVPALEDRFEKQKPSPLVYVKDMNRWTLDAGKFYIVAADSNVQMAWRKITGKELVTWDLEMLLSLCGYVYFVCHVANSKDQFSHARVMYGAWTPLKIAYFVDPSPKFPGSVAWEFDRIVHYDFLMAIDRDQAPSWQAGQWENMKTADSQ
jgi:hypothetical protein